MVDDYIDTPAIIDLHTKGVSAEVITDIINKDYLNALLVHCQSGYCTKKQVETWYAENYATVSQVKKKIKSYDNEVNNKQAVSQ